jgi:hypothetical protein
VQLSRVRWQGKSTALDSGSGRWQVNSSGSLLMPDTHAVAHRHVLQTSTVSNAHTHQAFPSAHTFHTPPNATSSSTAQHTTTSTTTVATSCTHHPHTWWKAAGVRASVRSVGSKVSPVSNAYTTNCTPHKQCIQIKLQFPHTCTTLAPLLSFLPPPPIHLVEGCGCEGLSQVSGVKGEPRVQGIQQQALSGGSSPGVTRRAEG